MNRIEFLAELEKLLQDISAEERKEQSSITKIILKMQDLRMSSILLKNSEVLKKLPRQLKQA